MKVRKKWAPCKKIWIVKKKNSLNCWRILFQYTKKKWSRKLLCVSTCSLFCSATNWKINSCIYYFLSLIFVTIFVKIPRCDWTMFGYATFFTFFSFSHLSLLIHKFEAKRTEVLKYQKEKYTKTARDDLVKKKERKKKKRKDTVTVSWNNRAWKQNTRRMFISSKSQCIYSF